jgi:sodium transport system permease protein
MFAIMGSAISGMEEDVKNNTTIAIRSEVANNNEVMSILEDEVFAGEQGIKLIAADDPVKMVNNEDAKLFLDVQKVPGSETLEMKLYFDENKMASTNSRGYVSDLINQYNNRALYKKLADLGIDVETLYPVKLEVANISELSGEVNNVGSGGIYLSMMLPMMLVIFLASGSMAAAVDMFAGEKERKTFEPLLTTQAGRLPVLLGKFIATNIFGLATTLMMFIGLAAGYTLYPQMLTMGMGEVTLKLPGMVIALSAMLVVLLTMIFSGIHVAISTWSRTVKEATSYSTFVMFAGMLPALGTMYMQGGDVKAWMMSVPVLNVIGALKMVLAGILRYDMILIAILSSAAFLAVVLYFTLNLFKKETVMFRL